jgi:chromosome segregation ATPase
MSMTDAFDSTDEVAEGANAEAETPGMRKLAVLPTPSYAIPRDRPVTNLGKVFGQFAELQQQIAEQVVTLEDSVQNQKADVAVAMAQLPELRERINWLIASFYEQSKKDETVRDRLTRHDAAIDSVLGAVKTIEAQQKTLLSAFDEMANGLARAKAAISGKTE